MKIFGLLAHPVAHSLSPDLYRGWFSEYGIQDAKFELFDVVPEELEDFFQKKMPKITGLAVSIPHKETVMQYLDEVDDVAKKIGAVNTIQWIKKSPLDRPLLKGWNTDWIGVREALCEANVEVRGQRVLVFGAGGAARAVVYALIENGAEVVIANRTLEKAESVAADFRCFVVHWDDRETVQADIVVNATSVGLAHSKNDRSSHDESPVSENFWDAKKIVAFDLVYRLKMTKFLRDAAASGAHVITGDRMLWHQGKAQFEILVISSDV